MSRANNDDDGDECPLGAILAGPAGNDPEDGDASNGAPSQHTMEMSLATRVTIETYYRNLFQFLSDRRERRSRLAAHMDSLGVPPEDRAPYWDQLQKLETGYIRSRRQRLTGTAFETIKIVGRGAFGEVRLVRAKGTGRLYAMKKLSKSSMVAKRQQLHVKAERDVLAAANEVYRDNPWIVKLHYSFQDASFLYLIMEFVPGGDLMSLLIKRHTFSEDETRFFVAETVIAVESIHRLNYVHRDIKPDNLLLDRDGHIKVSDFGLCQVIDVNAASSALSLPTGATGDPQQLCVAVDSAPAVSGAAAPRRGPGMHRRQLLYSNVGTPDYTAPEVLQSRGYGRECDFWSVGIILFEMLVGYPPFCSETAEETVDKIVHHESSLPPIMRDSCKHVSREARDLICRFLLAPQKSRIGVRGGMTEILAHPFFRGLDWRNIRSHKSPVVPSISSPTDTSHFDDFDELEGAVGGLVADTLSDKRRLKPHDIPFIGFTYRNFDDIQENFTASASSDEDSP